jgi:hypothetical protein
MSLKKTSINKKSFISQQLSQDLKYLHRLYLKFGVEGFGKYVLMIWTEKRNEEEVSRVIADIKTFLGSVQYCLSNGPAQSQNNKKDLEEEKFYFFSLEF